MPGFAGDGSGPVSRRVAIVALLAGGFGLLAAFGASVAVGPAFGLSLAAAWLVRGSSSSG